MAAKTFTTVALPDELIVEVDQLVKNNKLGFRSRPEFVKASIRKMILEIKGSK